MVAILMLEASVFYLSRGLKSRHKYLVVHFFVVIKFIFEFLSLNHLLGTPFFYQLGAFVLKRQYTCLFIKFMGEK